MTTTKTPADPDLALSEEQITAILADAQADAEQAAHAVAQAEAAACGEIPAGARLAAEVTPAGLAELRTAAELAGMRVQAAGKRVAEIRGKQLAAHQAAAADRVREHAAPDLRRADDLIGAVDAFEQALSGLYMALKGHNERVEQWRREMGAAQVPSNDSSDPGPLGATFRRLADGVRADGKAFMPLPAAKIVLATVREVMADDADVTYIVRNWSEVPGGPVDVRDRIRRDA